MCGGGRPPFSHSREGEGERRRWDPRWGIWDPSVQHTSLMNIRLLPLAEMEYTRVLPHYHPCMASMEIDPELSDTLMHLSG